MMYNYYNDLQEQDKPAKIVVPMFTQAKERPRLGRRGRVYTPKKTQQFEAAIAKVWSTVSHSMFTCPIKMTVIIREPIPKSYSGARRMAAEHGYISPPVGDLDNKVKAVQDGLNGIAYIDDKQINELIAKRTYGPNYHLEVIIERNGLSKLEIDQYWEQHGKQRRQKRGS